MQEIVTSNPFLAIFKNYTLPNAQGFKYGQSVMILFLIVSPVLKRQFPSLAPFLEQDVLNEIFGGLALYLTHATSAKI